ncbi:unnamed protein product [Ilex paraguariensis]|uniref:Uncharacterized protein n=1 Tax=Ilex paraguariensis TaxID=185542 RepID=A0ABC8RBC0_9AQUA
MMKKGTTKLGKSMGNSLVGSIGSSKSRQIGGQRGRANGASVGDVERGSEGDVHSVIGDVVRGKEGGTHGVVVDVDNAVAAGGTGFVGNDVRGADDDSLSIAVGFGIIDGGRSVGDTLGVVGDGLGDAREKRANTSEGPDGWKRTDMLGSGSLDASDASGEPGGEGFVLGFIRGGEHNAFSLAGSHSDKDVMKNVMKDS